MRSALNSESLSKKNKRLYQNFFANYPLIISSPAGTILAGAFSHQFGGIGLHQKIPLRNYLGIKRKKESGITYKHYGTYDLFSDCFIVLNELPELIDKFEFLETKLKKIKFKGGLEIGILNEIPRRSGLNNPGVQSANLAMIYMLFAGIIDEKELELFNKADKKIKFKKSQQLKKIIKEFHSIWIGPNNSGFGALSCFVDTSSPVIFQSQRTAKVSSLNRIFSHKENGILPYDVVIIGTSDRKDIDFSLRKYDEISAPINISKEEVRNFEHSGFNLKSESKEDANAFILKKYREAIDASALNCAVALGRLINKPDAEKLDHCFTAFNDAFYTLCLVSSDFKRKNKVANYLQSFFFECCPDLKYALATSIANNLVILFPREHFRDEMPKLKKYFEKKIEFEITYPYISWIDGFELGSTKIEQWRRRKKFSPIFPKGSLLALIIKKSSDEIVIKPVSSKEKIIKSLDLCFDLDDNKIFCQGLRVDSKDLPTTSASIELFEALTRRKKFCIKNKQLSSLSYFQDRNELQSKIISPLKNLVLKKIGTILNLKIHGGYSDFEISYFPSNLKIGLIKRN